MTGGAQVDSGATQTIERRDLLVLGGGLAGLAAGLAAGPEATVLECDDRPGGLVRTETLEGYWFDRVLHLLYFSDPATEARVRAIVGEDLLPCTPEAWVETLAGTVRYPLQMNLHDLGPARVATCLRDLAAVTFGPEGEPPRNFEEMLLATFGRGLCELFLFPYNRKVWKRPLTELAPSGFQWTITHPDFDQVLKGALTPGAVYHSYNSAGWYPRPAEGSLVRGMEVISRALAARVDDLRLGHRVEAIDLERRTVTTRQRGELTTLAYRRGCCSTLPLPLTVALVRQAPAELVEQCRALPRNRVISVALAVRGTRPRGRGHWRYYSDPERIFSRLIHMHDFDPLTAPPEGWGLLAEITQRSEAPLEDEVALVRRVEADARAVGALGAEDSIVASRCFLADPAYVVFTPTSAAVVERAQSFLAEHDIHCVGRYARWEYTSMSQVMRDGFAWGDRMRDEADKATAPQVSQAQ